MRTTIALKDMKGIKYGYGHIGNKRTYKTRLSPTNSAMFFEMMPASLEKHFMFYTTRKGYMFVACIESHEMMGLWSFIERVSFAIKRNVVKAKMAKKQAIIDKKAQEIKNLNMWFRYYDNQDDLPF